MLSFACLRFRARFDPHARLASRIDPGARLPSRFSPGEKLPHRGSCAQCDAYATALERAAAVCISVPGRLAEALRDIPGRQTVVAFPVTRVPLPAALHDRLRAIPRQAARPRPPAWIRSPRYAIAASILLTVLFGAFGGDPGKSSRALTESLSAGVTSVVRAADGLLSRIEGDQNESR